MSNSKVVSMFLNLHGLDAVLQDGVLRLEVKEMDPNVLHAVQDLRRRGLISRDAENKALVAIEQQHFMEVLVERQISREEADSMTDHVDLPQAYHGKAA